MTKKLQENSHNCVLMKFSFSRRVAYRWISLKKLTTNGDTINKFKTLLDDAIGKIKYPFD